MTYPWWMRSIGVGVGTALAAAIFSDMIFTLGLAVLPLSNETYEQWADNPPTAVMCLIVGVLATVFALGVQVGQRRGEP